MTVERHIRSSIASALTAGPAALGLLLMFSSLSHAENPATEYQVKAAFLLNFTKFVEWPATAFENPDSALSICILGDDPFGSVLDQLIEGEAVNGRKLTVRRLRDAPRPKSCQVLFIAGSMKDVQEILSGLGPGVLTVGDRDSFLREGGIIAFITEGRHIRFDIDLRAAEHASLTLNARLLNVARSVRK